VLLGLDRLWKLGLGPAGLHPLARRLGADVPYFLVGGTALGLARGDEVYPLWNQVAGHVVVVDPERPLSTAAVFRRLDRSLTPREETNRIFRFISRGLDGPEAAFPILSNDLERPALEEAPDLAARVERIRGILIRERALVASLSGSGASYFGLFDDPGRARTAQARLTALGFKALRGPTLSLNQYRRRWALASRAVARGSDQGRSGHHGDHRRQGHPGR
jgi:4-diphosphocytidyl-2-C-methyl-D-erythritol kinase